MYIWQKTAGQKPYKMVNPKRKVNNLSHGNKKALSPFYCFITFCQIYFLWLFYFHVAIYKMKDIDLKGFNQELTEKNNQK